MFNKKEDKVFEYAFGDLSAREAQIFEAGLLKDDATAEEAKFLQSIKGDLASFRDIPEMQYSKERLRDAILGQGLKPSKPSLPWLNMVLAPGAMVCVFALGYVLMNGTSRKAPVVIGTSPQMANNSFKGPQLPVQKLEAPTPFVADKGHERTEIPAVRDIDGSTGHKMIVMSFAKSRVKHSRTSGMMVSRTIDIVGPPADIMKPFAAASSGGSASFESANDALADPSKPIVDTNNTLILIDKDQDSGVGAPVATEVNDSKNVIIGG